MIEQSTIDRVMQAADIVDVVSDFVSLRKTGASYKGLCPFHDDKTPSFTVTPSRQICKCFSCGSGGNVVKFIMLHEQLTYPEAIKWLAKKYGIEVKESGRTDEQVERSKTREAMFLVNEWARDFFETTLHNDPDGIAVGMSYFRSRGFRDDTIRKFQLGYSPDNKDALCRTAKEKGQSVEVMVKTGLCYENGNGGFTDRFRGRVIFPIHTVSGRVVGFGGRVLAKATKGVAQKYVNSPESEIYSKSHELYGLFQAKSAIVKQGCCYIVEGYTDVISMHQSGVENVVASSGTALTEGQIRLIHRFTPNVTMLFDGDAAGIKAALRGTDLLLAQGLNIKVVLLPENEDPDSYARAHSAEEFRNYISSHEVDFIKFKTDLLLKDAGKDPIKRSQIVQNIVESISVIPDDILRQMYIHECAQQTGMTESIILDAVTKRRRQSIIPTSAENKPEGAAQQEDSQTSINQIQAPTPPKSTTEAQERAIAIAVVKYGGNKMYEGTNSEMYVTNYIVSEMQNDDIKFENPLYSKVITAAQDLITTNPDAEQWLSRMMSYIDFEVADFAGEVAEDSHVLCKRQMATFRSDIQRLEEYIPRVVLELKYQLICDYVDSLLAIIKEPKTQENATLYLNIMSQYNEYLGIKRNIGKTLGDRVLV